jgi:NAD-dependent SIR2 family protein deacetylase
MATHAAPLGRCPDCEATIPAGSLLIEYERRDGPACYAECPDCREVVRPRSRAG